MTRLEAKRPAEQEGCGMVRRLFTLLRLHFRRQRYRSLMALLRIESNDGLILDLGGGPASFFTTMFLRAERVILADIDYDLVRQAKKTQPAIHAMVADGEWLPLAECSVGVTICNSVIEHVNDPDSLAAEIRRISQSYFLQTPNGDFPVETHSFIGIPLYNFTPWTWLQRLVCRVFGADFEYVSSVHYLSEQRLLSLFPQATIGYERVLGLTKSFYVYHLGERTE